MQMQNQILSPRLRLQMCKTAWPSPHFTLLLLFFFLNEHSRVQFVTSQHGVARETTQAEKIRPDFSVNFWSLPVFLSINPSKDVIIN